jgi:hypothetical protein
VNILGGDSRGHCEQKSSYEHVSNSEWLRKYCCLNLKRALLPHPFPRHKLPTKERHLNFGETKAK